MLRQKLIQSVQAGPFNSTQNRIIDIDIADGQVVNLAQSHLVFTTQIVNPSPQVMNLVVAIQDNPHVTPFNCDFVRNAWLSGAKVGRLEDCKRVNIYAHNILELSKSQVEKQSQVITLYQTRDNETTQLLSPYVDFKKTGTSVSSFRQCKLRIPLSQLFSLGNQVIDTSLTGTLRVHLELENGFSFVVQNEPLFQGVANEGVLENTVSGSTFNVLSNYLTDADSPYCIGMNYSLTYTNAANPPVTTTNVVNLVGASYNADRQLSLTFTGPGLPLADQGGGANYSDISLEETDTLPNPAPALQIALVECNVAEVINSKMQKINELTYTTWGCEEYSCGDQQFVSKVFILEPNCVNCLVMVVGARGSPLSNNIDIESYRLRVGGEDVTDRDVRVQLINANAAFNKNYFDETLHYDQIMRTFANSGGLPLKNYSQVAMSRDGQSNVIYTSLNQADGGKYGVEANRLIVLATPTPMTVGTKEFQVNINCRQDGTIENLIVFKQLVRTVSFK